MSLREHILSPAERRKLAELYKLLTAEPRVREFVRAAFVMFANTEFSEYLEPYKVSRLMSDPSKNPYARQVLLYDFSVERLPSLLESDGKILSAAKATLQELIKLRPRRRQSPLDLAAIGYEVDEIPSAFVRPFLGYRRGSREREIIRFFISIEYSSFSKKRVIFNNIYIRDDVKWEVVGSGVYVNETLYLVGQARSRSTGSSLGLRFFGLRLSSEEMVEGVLLSMDEAFSPIAGKGVLIPFYLHDLAFDYERVFADISGVESSKYDHESVARKKEEPIPDGRLLGAILLNGNDQQKLESEINLQLRRFKSLEGRHDVKQELEKKISNITTTVIGIDHRTSHEYLLEAEQRFRIAVNEVHHETLDEDRRLERHFALALNRDV